MTQFFRDRPAFDALERFAIADLAARRGEDPVRVWVPACATGEEAYSIAMLLAQEPVLWERGPQVFATDIDEIAIARAREGTYPRAIETDVPYDLLRHHFVREDDAWRVARPIRERVLFAPHDVLRDPPFTRLDLISCRNLLMDLERPVQAGMLEMFHFALRPGGYLFLGTAETADAAAPWFSVVDRTQRLYRANVLEARRTSPRLTLGGPAQHVAGTGTSTGAGAGAGAGDAPGRAARGEGDVGALHQRLAQAHALPSLLLGADGHVLHSLRCEHYLRFTEGVPSHQAFAVVEPALRPALRLAVLEVRRSGAPVRVHGGSFTWNGERHAVALVVAPVEEPGQEPMQLVTFHELPPEEAAGDGAAPIDPDPAVRHLEAELQRKESQLERTVLQYETTLEELRASNEELQAVNEELRVSSEALETSKEELQSTNEELGTVNNELKHQVEETAKLNDDLQNLIGSTGIATVIVDRQMRIKRYTPAAAQLFGIIAGDIGRSLLDLALANRIEGAHVAEDAAAAIDDLRTVEREIQGAENRWYLARTLPYRTGEDRIDGAVLTFVDITRRHSAERRVDLESERMALIAASLPDLAILTTDEEGRITSWSQGAATIFGYLEDEVLGRSVDLIYTPEDRVLGMPAREMAVAREHGRALDERWHLRRDGSRVFVSGILAPMRLGRQQGFAKIARDMTEREKEDSMRSAALESAVADANQATAANRLKDEFLAVMSHELKNPLNLIQVNAQLLLSQPAAKETPAIARIARTIQHTVEAQARIIDDLLDVSRVRAGKLMLQLAPVRVGDVLQAPLTWAAEQARQRGVTFEALLEDEGITVQADAVRIEQVMLNLLGNALKFTPKGGRVLLEVRREEGDVVMTVADDGQGIDPAFLPHVFEMFRQAGAGGRSAGGLGIGLSLVRDLVEMHGGSVAAASAGRDRGATLTVRLPAQPDSDFGRLSADASPLGLEGLRVLYVDDSAETLELFSMLLETEGAVADTARSAAEAIELLSRERVDLVISDIGMPGMDGYAFIAQVRALPDGSVPAIALTGYSRPQDVEAALRAGFDAHLAKPIELGQLRQVIGRLPGLRRARR